MAIRNIVKLGDEILTKKCREVKEINDRIICLLEWSRFSRTAGWCSKKSCRC